MAYMSNQWYYYNTNTINKSKYRVFKHYYKDSSMVLQHHYIIKYLWRNWWISILTLGVFWYWRQTYKEYQVCYMEPKTFTNYWDAGRYTKLLEQPVYWDEMQHEPFKIIEFNKLNEYYWYYKPTLYED